MPLSVFKKCLIMELTGSSLRWDKWQNKDSKIFASKDNRML